MTTSLFALALVSLIGLARPAGALPATTGPTIANSPTQTAVIRFEGVVDDYTRDGLITRFNRAKAAGAKVIIIDIDTYGGLVTSGLSISQFLKHQTDVHTVAYVGHKAISAGAMIAMACNEIVMASSAQLGDCAPISIKEDGSLQTMGKHERGKSESPILADFLNSADRNGYDPLLAQAMVSMELIVRWVENASGERRFVDQKTFEALTKEGWKEVVEPGVATPLDSELSLLTISGAVAHKLGLARSIQPDIEAMARDRNYNVIARYAPGAGDKVIEFLNNPFFRMLLMMIFAQCLYAAVHAPGHGFAEVLALMAMTILVGVPLMTGHAEWWEIVVVLLGICLVGLEIFVIPGFGIPGILGFLMILFGLIMTFVGKEPAGPGVLPQLPGTWSNLRNGLAMVTMALVASIFVSMWLRRFLPRLPYFNRLILTATTGNLDQVAPEREMAQSLEDYRPVVGAIGQTLSELKPGGSVTFFDPIAGEQKIYSALSDVGYIEAGAKVAVRNNSDNRIIVRPVV